MSTDSVTGILVMTFLSKLSKQLKQLGNILEGVRMGFKNENNKYFGPNRRN